MTTSCLLPLDSSCCNCLQSICVDSFVAVFNICGSRVSVREGLQLAFHPHSAATTTRETPYQFLKLCTLCAEILQRLLNTHAEFTRLTAADSYVEVLRQKLCTAQTQLEHEKLKLNLPALGRKETKSLIATENLILHPTTECILQRTLARKQRTTRSVIRAQNVKKIESVHVHRTRKAETPEAEEKDPLALTDDESETHQVKLRRSTRKRKEANWYHQIVTRSKDSKSVCNLVTSDVDNDVDFHEGSVEEFGAKKVSCLKKKRKLEVGKTVTKVGFSNEDKDILCTKTYKCDECKDVSFESYKSWVLHQESVHALDMKYGDVSGKETLVPLDKYLRPCPECGKKYKTNSEVIYHMRSIHLDIRPYSCDTCQKGFRTKYTYKTHVEIVHSIEKPQHLCVLCAASFKTKSGLLTHEKTHMGLVTNNIECTICHSKYSHPSRLRDHMASAHSDATPFVCDQCGKAFKVQRLLQKHIKKQHYKKFIIDFICKLCGKGYAFKDKLKDHLMSVHKLSKDDARVSVGSRPQSLFRVLPNGERVFNEKPTKPKTCSFCGRSYVRREQLFTHLMSVHAQTQEQAKEITGLESKRNLLPGADDIRNGKRK